MNTIKKNIISLVFLAIPMIGQASVCENWSVTVGQDGGGYGVWTYTSGTPEFMNGEGYIRNSSGDNISFSLKADVINGNVYVERRMSSNKNDCNYTGKKVGNYIGGTYICTQYTPSPLPWKAIVSKCNKKL
jgi:hypothetical protein